MKMERIEQGAELGRSSHARNEYAPRDGWRAEIDLGNRRPWAYGDTRIEARNRLQAHVDRITAAKNQPE